MVKIGNLFLTLTKEAHPGKDGPKALIPKINNNIYAISSFSDLAEKNSTSFIGACGYIAERILYRYSKYDHT